MVASTGQGSYCRRLPRQAGLPALVVLLIATLFLGGGCTSPDRPSVVPTSPQATAAATRTALPTLPAPPSPSPSPAPTRAPSPQATATPAPTAAPTVPPTPAPTLSQVVLGAENTDRYVLESGALRHSHGLVVLTGTAYLVDAGELVAIPLVEGGPARRLSPPEGQIESFPVGEIMLAALSADSRALLLLDKRGDLYRYDPAADLWSVERPIDRRRSSPNPVPAAVASYNGRAYLLDISYSQVWRFPYDEDAPEGYLAGGDSPGNRTGTSLDITRGIDLGVYWDVYVLLQEGRTVPAGLARFTGSSPKRDKGFAPALALESPTHLYLEPAEEGRLYVIDREGHRLQVLDRKTGDTLQTLTFVEDAVEMRGVYLQGGRLYIAALDALYAYPGTGQAYTIPGGVGPAPAERPDDPQRLANLPAFTVPIAGARFLPDRPSLLPGSPRVYRYGIHHGLDLYGGTMGVDVPYGAPARAAAVGTVIRADVAYHEITPAGWDELSALCDRLHTTPLEVENLYRGRQIWVDHGNGVVTHYAHLSAIAEGVVTGTVVTAGQVIGYVGNSGTSDGVAGNKAGAHLHFEVFLNGHYLGEWLSLMETRRLWQRLLFP